MKLSIMLWLITFLEVIAIWVSEVGAGLAPFDRSELKVGHKVRRNISPGTKVKPDANYTEASFLESDKWSTLYPGCNPKLNEFTSPINISSSDAVNAKNVQTLFVYSGEPERDTYLVSSYYLTNGYYMEALTIRLQGEEDIGHATTISGLGHPSKRFFDSAVLLVKGNDFKVAGSFSGGIHMIDFKRYPMEIVFTFKTNTGADETQIHVMVEIAEEINPVWQPLTELYDKIFSKVIEDTCYGESLRQQGQENYDKATLAYTTLLTQQKEETDGLTYQDLFQGLKTFYEAVKCCDSNKILDVETQAAAEFAKAQECDAGLAPNQERMEVVGTQIEDLESKIQQLKANGELYDDEEDALIKAVAEYKKIIEKEEELHACSKKHGDKYIELSRKYAEMQKIRETYKIGPGVENLFHSVADVLKDMNEAQKNLEDLENAKAFYENATSVLEKIETVPSRSIDVRLPFQISWLFPPYGGHYFYNGSSPLPPCGRKVFVIVLEKPITISPEQLRVFQKIPSVHQHDSSVWKKLCDKSADDQEKMSVIEKMDNVVSRFPITNPLPKRVVWYNPKNLQYKMDDGVHMKSSTRRKLKQELENEENSAGTPELRDYWIVMLLCILSYQSYHLDEKLNV